MLPIHLDANACVHHLSRAIACPTFGYVDQTHGNTPVSYTHLDVYKRQVCSTTSNGASGLGGNTSSDTTHFCLNRSESGIELHSFSHRGIPAW